MGSGWLSLFHKHIPQVLLQIFFEILETTSYILNTHTPWLEMGKKTLNGGMKCLGLLKQGVVFDPFPTQCFKHCLRSIGTVEFFWKDASASFRPSARNLWSSCKASTIFRILSSNKSRVTAASWMQASALRVSYSARSSFSFPSPRSTSPSHFPLTDSCRATFMSHASAFNQNRPCGCAFLSSLIAST